MLSDSAKALTRSNLLEIIPNSDWQKKNWKVRGFIIEYVLNPDVGRLTWTGKGYRLILIGAKQTHEFRGLSVIQGKQAVVVLRPIVYMSDH